MPAAYKSKVNLRYLDFFPDSNPLVEVQEVKVKKRYVRIGRTEKMVNADTAEIVGVTAIHQIEEKDDAEFVKVFAHGVAASYDLSKTAQKVFYMVLEQYQKEPLIKGYADNVHLFWHGDGLNGKDSMGMSERSFKRGLKELLDKRFLAPRSPSCYWVNPMLFFKGDRVMFIREYRKRRGTAKSRAELEHAGQQRLVGLD